MSTEGVVVMARVGVILVAVLFSMVFLGSALGAERAKRSTAKWTVTSKKKTLPPVKGEKKVLSLEGLSKKERAIIKYWLDEYHHI